jgi:hypothetical protein
VSGTCAPSSAGLPAGSSCSVPAECASGSCYQGGCLGGLSGQPCTSVSDCVSGLRCVSTSSTTNVCLLPMAQ